MGPSRRLFFNKNRSAQSVHNSRDTNEKASLQPSPVESPLHSPAFPPLGQYKEEEEEGEDQYDIPYRSEDPRHYQSGQPTRSQSQRSPSLINTNLPQPTIHLVGPAHSTPSSAIDETSPDHFYRQVPAPNPPEHKEDRKKRRFFGIGSSSKETTNNPAPANLGRSISIRRREQLPKTLEELGHHPSQHEWSSAHVSPTDDYEEEEGAGLHPSRDKDPLRSPGLPPSISHKDYSQRNSEQHNTSPSQVPRQPLDRQGSHDSSWARTLSNVHHRSYVNSAPQQTSTTSGQYYQRLQNDTLHQHWQEQQHSRPSSSQSLEPPPLGQHPRNYDTNHTRAASSQASSLSQYTQGSMGPPPQAQNSSRRPSEAQQQHPGEQGREGGYQPYAQTVQGGSVLPSNAPPQYSGLASQAQNFRTNSQASPMQQQGSSEQGRGTPPPSRSRDELSNMDIAQLLQRHDELREFSCHNSL